MHLRQNIKKIQNKNNVMGPLKSIACPRSASTGNQKQKSKKKKKQRKKTMNFPRRGKESDKSEKMEQNQF